MKRKYMVVFLLCILALAASEYLFLSELSNQQRVLILIPAVLLAVASIVTIVFCYKRFRKDA